MELTDEQVLSFIECWEKDFGERLSLDQARGEAMRLLTFFGQMEALLRVTSDPTPTPVSIVPPPPCQRFSRGGQAHTDVYNRGMNRTEKKDLEGYAFLRSQILQTGVAPSLREIGRAVGYSSPRSVQLMMVRLETKGLIKRVDGVIRLSGRKRTTTGDHVIEVPLVGSVACGAPMLAQQEPEALIPISTRIARPGHRYFLLRASGTSMNRAGIRNGDLVLVRQQQTAEEGDKVVALINDDATIKRFHRERDVVVLRPDSTDKSHKPIVLTEDFIIQGVVVSTLPSNLY
jgi:repressor LexA